MTGMKNRLILYSLSILLFSLFLSTSLDAQYQGGSGDGAYKSSTIQLTLNGDQINPLGLYRGGNGDGQDKNSVLTTLTGFDITNMYEGGSGDGHTKDDFSGSLLGTDLSSLYLGGIGDGSHKSDFQGILDGESIEGLYLGGFGDGHSKLTFTGILDGLELSQLYQGGSGDGHYKDDVSTLLDGQDLSQLYAGGEADGFSKDQFLGVLDGSKLDGLYSGGSGDGFSKNNVQYIFSFPECTFVVNTDDDGFGSLRYAIDCAAPGDTIEFSPLLMNEAINIFSNPLVVSQDLHINANPAANLTVDGSILPNAFQTGLNGQANITIRGLDIIAGTDFLGGAIQNGAVLTLEDLDIIDTNGTSMSVIANFNGGALIIRGTVQILSN